MKRIYSTFIALLAAAFLLGGCTSTFDGLNTNPDAPEDVTSSMLATKMILDMTQSASNWRNEFLVKRMVWGEQMDDGQYNRFGHGSFDGVKLLTNAQKMVEYAGEKDKDAYTGLFYFLKGWYFYQATMDMGDIPYSEALDIDTYRTPKYDEQKEVFRGILSDLEQAEAYFVKAAGQTFDGDPFYHGSTGSWRKATNVLRLKVLMTLQKRAEDTPELKVKETFAQIVSEGNLFTGNGDNLQVTYSDKEGQQNPMHNTLTRSIEVYGASTMLTEPLKQYRDYRLFYYLAPAQALTDPLYLPKGETLLEADDWNAYPGLDIAGAFNDEHEKIADRMHSRPNDVYRLSYEGVPCIRLGYADMNFILAEAVERGWITGNARKYYEEGVRAAFAFVKSTVPAHYAPASRAITDAYVEAYLQQPETAYKEAGTVRERLEQIWMQAYLAGYFHLAKDAYYEFRRTGYPVFPVNPLTNLNDAKDKIPVRYMYPESETSYNKEQLTAALQRQWNGTDDVNNRMWLIK